MCKQGAIPDTQLGGMVADQSEQGNDVKDLIGFLRDPRPEASDMHAACAQDLSQGRYAMATAGMHGRYGARRWASSRA